MLKKNLRKEYILKRNSLSTDEWEMMNQEMLGQFSTVALQGIQYLLSYYPIADRQEFDTTACEDLMKLDNEQLQICWPRLLQDGTNMEAVVKDRHTRLVPNRFNIPEPVGGEVVEPQILDAVFVPLLAFDEQGYRVGYGKGYYDRYLAQCAQDVVKIGFSFFDAVKAIEDINPFDVPLNFCITPKRVYEF